MLGRFGCVSICGPLFVRSVSSLYRPVFPVHHVLFAHGSVGEPARVSASQADGYVTCFSPVRSRVRARASLCPRVTVLLGWFRNSSAGRKTVSEFDLQGVRDSCPARPLQDRNSRSLSRKTLTGQKFPISVQQDPSWSDVSFSSLDPRSGDTISRQAGDRDPSERRRREGGQNIRKADVLGETRLLYCA